MNALLAALTMLIRDWAFSSTYVPPPAPPSSPSPSDGTAFSASIVGRIDGVVGTPIVSLTIATTVTAEASIYLYVTGVPDGLTVSHDNSTPSAGVLSIDGTPTTAGAYRIRVLFLRTSDGAALGSTFHDCSITDAANTFTIGDMANPVIVRSRASSTEMCTLDANYNVDIRANSYLLGVRPVGISFEIEWAPGPASTGRLVMNAYPGSAGSFDATYVYRDAMMNELGRSVHTVTVVEPYVAPTPVAPSPAPAPAPADPPPTPAPAPAPGVETDPLFGSVVSLVAFDVKDAGAVADDVSPLTPVVGAIELSSPGAASQCMLLGPGRYGSRVAGVWSPPVCIEAFVLLDDLAPLFPAGILYGGDFGYFCPAVSLVNPGGGLVWSLGFYNIGMDAGDSAQRAFVRLGFLVPTSSAYGGVPLFCAFPLGWESSPGRWLRVAGQVSVSGSVYTAQCWLDGSPGDSASIDDTYGVGAIVAAHPSATLQFGGSVELPGLIRESSPVTRSAPMSGKIDESRVTLAQRRSGSYSNPIPPWPRS